MGGNRLALIEAKASATVRPEAGDAVAALMASARGYQTWGLVVHRPRPTAEPLRALRPRVDAVPLERLLASLRQR